MSLFEIVQGFNRQLREKNHQTDTMKRSQRQDFIITMNTQIAILILDRSYSMSIADYSPSRLQAAIDSAIEYVLTLKKRACNIRVAVISFSLGAKVVVPPTSISNTVKIIGAIRSIAVDGGTDIATGLMQAEDILRQSPEKKPQSQIVLLTDGFGSEPVGIADKLKTQYHTVIDVIGIGGNSKDVNENLLTKVATTDPNGTSHYRFIKDR